MVIVETEGPDEWTAAERRLGAELLEAGQDVIYLRAASDVDRELPTYAPRFRADAVIQVLRRDREGIVRLWLSDAERISGAYRHLVVDLRGADVISEATLPAVELALNGRRELARTTPQPVPKPSAVSFLHDRSTVHLTARLLAGVMFPGGGAVPSANLDAGVRVGLLPFLTLDADVFAEPARSAMARGETHWSLGVSGARALLAYEPWPRSPISLALAAGAGISRLSIEEAQNDVSEVYTQYLPLLVGRVQLAAPVFQRVDALLMLSWSKAWPGADATPLSQPGGPELFEPGFDAAFGFDVHWF